MEARLETGVAFARRTHPAHAAVGFTLVELCVVLAMAGVLAAAAIPSYQARMEQARRTDAHAALLRVQAAQEQFRSHHGLYAPALSNLGTAGRTRSEAGHYTVTLERHTGEAYRATATVRPEGPQRGDTACERITLDVQHGFAQLGPSARCWGR
jgi:type IV pilus assembly protein PilE